jgi:hypothetical protein
MRPEKQRTLQDVCGFLASRTTFPRIEELRALGGKCKTGAAFLALRNEMKTVGVEVRGVKPSTPVSELLRIHSVSIIRAFIRLAPGRLPRLSGKANMGERICGWTFLAGLAILFTSGWITYSFPVLLADTFALLFGFLGLWIFSNLPPARVSVDNVVTFGDFARIIADAHSNKQCD